MKNPADDVSFKELGQIHSKRYYLEKGIESRIMKINALSEKIGSETRRLKEQGYDMKDLVINIIKGLEE